MQGIQKASHGNSKGKKHHIKCARHRRIWLAVCPYHIGNPSVEVLTNIGL